MLHVALSVFPYRQRKLHWTVAELKERLGVRVLREMEVDGFLLSADPFDGPGKSFWREGLTEPETRRVVADILKPGAVMFDVGAYVGQFSLVASRVAPEIRIFAFEPTPQVFAQMQRNIRRNGCKNTTCIQAALSDSPGTAKLFYYPQSHDQNSLKALDPGARSVEVRVETVDSVIAQQRLNRLDLLKIDTEGNELAVLRGATTTLATLRPRLIVEISRHQRTYGYSGREIAQLLQSKGYTIRRIGQTCEPYIFHEEEIGPRCSHFNIVAEPPVASATSGLR
ncbi:MAG: FkbM family methyltransferase [Bryobacterales bacterium]|nr:FkbM family methyltransferase [Bryobacterales bacterium]